MKRIEIFDIVFYALIIFWLVVCAIIWAAKPPPKPPPTKPAPGPVIAYGVTTAGIQPTMLLSCDRNRWKIGDAGTYTCLIAMPADSATPAWGAVWWFQVVPGFVVTQVTGPLGIYNVAQMTYMDDTGIEHTVASEQVAIWVSNTLLPNRPDAQGVLRVELGDLWMGESEIVTVTLQRVN